MSKIIAWRKLKKIFLRLQNFKIFETFDLIILKNGIFPNQKTIYFFNHREIWYRTEGSFDIELGGHFYHYFEILLILAQNAESAKNFQVQNFIVSDNKHHSQTRKIHFRVNFLIHDSLAGLKNPDFILQDQFFFLIYSASLWIFKRLQNLEMQLILESSGHRNSTTNFRTLSQVQKKVIESQICTQAAWPLLFCWFLTYHANFEVS